jgi:OPA family sugar phosphate sensor protein UhpC-like MFS transporter
MRPMTPDPLTSEQASKLKTWRRRVFASTWLSYVGYYFCRKPFYIVKADLGDALNLGATDLGFLGTAYLLAYSAGQFIAGTLGNRSGPRILLLTGMLISIAANIGFGFADSLGTFTAFIIVNGLAQATGWPGSLGSMAAWFKRKERGTVMGFWATNFQFGGIAANGVAAWMLHHYGFRYAFFAGSAFLLFVWCMVFLFQRNGPVDVGLPPLDDADHSAAVSLNRDEETESDGSPKAVGTFWGIPKNILSTVLLVGAFYFFVKFIRYALWSWVPYFLQKTYGLAGDDAGYISTIFDIGGVIGVIAAGVLSDRFFAGRRAQICFIFLAGMTLSCGVLFAAGGASVVLFAVVLGAVGFFLYGPDALMTGAGAIDIGTRRATVFTAGVINGLGSLGSVAQELVIGRLYDSGGGDLGPIFLLLFGSAFAAMSFVGVILWRNRQGHSDL